MMLELLIIAQLLGDHPQHSPDPYAHASAIRSKAFPTGLRCCDGRDCKPYHGPPPVRVVGRTQDGATAPGYLFAGRWFFEDDRRIDPTTLGSEARGIPALCINAFGDAMCFHWPTQG